MTEIAETTTLTKDERQEALDGYIATMTRGGWRVESRSEYGATMVKGHRPNHWLHAIATILTAGLWAIVWVLRVVLGGEKRMAVRVNDRGEMIQQRG